MIPGLFENLWDTALLGYISFRTAMAGLTGLVLALALGGPTIAWLKRHRVGEDVTKTDSIALADLSQRMGKQDTPTMGGSFLVASLLISTLLWARLDNVHVVMGLILTAGLAAVGFVDDFKKLTVPHSKGLSAKSKLAGQTVITVFTVGAMVWYARDRGLWDLLSIWPPFFKDLSFSLGESYLGLGVFVLFGWLVVAGTSNAVNITDGMDGLAAGLMVISWLALSVMCYITGRPDYTFHLHLPHVQDASEMAVVGGAVCGSCMGFLWFNAFPAKVFMGDSGSLPLGGLLGWMALIAKQELVLPLIGFVFFAELGSSALQTKWYRLSGGKRLFTMAPVHHGLQLKGGVFRPGTAPWHEVTVVVRFWIIAAACAIASLALMKVR